MTTLSTISATIFGNADYADEEQQVQIEYSGTYSGRFMVDYLKVVTALDLEPGDLYTDLALAIERHQGADVRIECEILVMLGIPTIGKPEYQAY